MQNHTQMTHEAAAWQKLIQLGLIIFGFIAIGTIDLHAQFSSAVAGTVTDTTGAVIPNATVILTNVGTSITHRMTASGEGYYRFLSLPAAGYTLTAKAKGFKTTVQHEFTVEVAETKTVNLVLEVGAVSDVVTVSDAPPVVETSEARVSGEVGQQEIQDLPMVGNNSFSFILFTPGVSGLPSGGTQQYAQATPDIFNNQFALNVHASGLRVGSNKLLVDDGSVTSYVTRGTTNLSPNAEAVQEMRVEVTNFSAQYATAAGALVNIVTKQGTNTVHGSLNYFHSDNVLTSRDIFESSMPVYQRHEITGSLGGPIWKDRTFAFGSIDVLRSGVAVGQPVVVPTADFLSFMKQNNPNNISTYLWTTFPAAVTPTSGFTTAGSILNTDCSTSPTTIPSPVGNIPCSMNVIGATTYGTMMPRNGIQWNVRFDHVFNHENDRLSASMFRTTMTTYSAGVPSVYPAFNTLVPQGQIFSNANETHIFTPNFINEFGFTYNRPTGILGCSECQVPTISITGANGPGSGYGYGWYIQNNFEWRDFLSYNLGAHAIKVGVNEETGQSNTDFRPADSRPTYSFANALEFAADYPYSQSGQQIDPLTGADATFQVDDRNHTYGWFVQDDWKVKPNLTINLGLRWEDLGNFHEASGNTTNIDFGTGDTFTEQLAGASMQVVKKMLPNDLTNNWAPRVSFAWDPTQKGKMSIRGGFGLFYDHVSSGFWGAQTANPPFVASVTGSIYTSSLPVYALGTSGTYPYGFQNPSNIVLGLNSYNGLLSGITTVGGTQKTLRPAYSENWFFGVQYQLAKSWAVELDDIGSAAHRQYMYTDINRFDGDLIQNNNVLTRISSNFGEMLYSINQGTAFYSGGTAVLKGNAFRGLTIQAVYTFSKSLDDQSDFDYNGGPDNVPDVNNYKALRGPSDYDARNRFTMNLIYTTPRPDFSSRLVNKALGGWQISDVTTLQSGNPFSVYCTTPFVPIYTNGVITGNSGCDYNADGFDYDVPNTPSFGNTKTGLSRSDYMKGIFVASDFSAPALGSEGNLGRNTFHGPGYANSDISLAKSGKVPWFTGKDKADLTLQCEFFNAFNRVNLTDMEGDIASSEFGKATSTYSPRTIQFDLKFKF